MSKISAKTEQVYREGKMRRGQFTPKGKPKDIYKFWASHSENVPSMENFCHFWRVVVFWAPLMKIRLTAIKMAEKPGTWIAVAIAYVLLAIGLTAGVDIGFGGMILTPYAFAGTFLGAMAGIEGYGILNEDNDVDVRWLFWLTGLVSIPTALIIKGINAISKRTWEKIGIAILVLVGTVVVVAGVVALVIGFMNDWVEMLQAIGLIAGATLSLLVVFVGLNFTYDHFANKRKQAYADALDAFYEGTGPDPDAKPETIRREPGKVRKFFRSIGEFFGLLFNVVRVNKWKICPIVTIDDK